MWRIRVGLFVSIWSTLLVVDRLGGNKLILTEFAVGQCGVESSPGHRIAAYFTHGGQTRQYTSISQ